MPVDTPSAEYAEQSDAWAKARALLSGVEKARDLLAGLPGMADDRSALFRKFAYFLPAFGRTVELFGGLLFIRPPTITDAPAALDAYLDDVTRDGVKFDGLAAKVADEILSVGRCAVLVDYPPAAPGLTIAEAEAAGLRAYARMYVTESILATEFQSVNGVRKLTHVRLKETTQRETSDRFVYAVVERVRILDLVGGVYTVEVQEKNSAGKWVTVEGPTTPIRKGAPLAYIPIAFFNQRDNDPTPIRPPLADLADVNTSHLQSSALNEWGQMWTANPTPWLSGVAAPPTNEQGVPLKGHEVKLGSSEVLILQQGGEAGFLEFTGAGLERIQATLASKEKHMGQLGVRILLDDAGSKQVTTETARIQNAGEHSTLARISDVISRGMTAVLRELSRWAGVDGEAALYDVNKNFLPGGIDPAELTALVQAFQKGAIGARDLFERLQEKEIIGGDRTFEEWDAERQETQDKLAESIGRIRNATKTLEGPPAGGA